MNKSELIGLVAKETNQTRATARDVVDAALVIITQSLKAGDPVTLIDFGSFGISDRAARNGYNPRSGERMRVKSSRVVKFTASAKLKAVARKATTASAAPVEPR